MTEAEARAIFLLAGIQILSIHKIENGYWPASYVELRQNSPWWLVQVPEGLIKIGWRKRVISINWESCSARFVVTTDDVTKDDAMVHAYSLAKAVEYLTSWACRPPAAEPAQGGAQ